MHPSAITRGSFPRPVARPALAAAWITCPRWPAGWSDDHQGIKLSKAFAGPGVEINSWMQHYLDSDADAWNLQGRFIDMAAALMPKEPVTGNCLSATLSQR